MKKKIRKIIDEALRDGAYDENDKWFLRAVHYGDWLDARRKRFTGKQTLDMLEFLSASTTNSSLADKLMTFVKENKGNAS